jgi:hypothetical protein
VRLASPQFTAGDFPPADGLVEINEIAALP